MRSKTESTLANAPQPNTARELDHRLRSPLSRDALIAVEWLNTTKGTQRRNVLDMRQEFEELGVMLDSLHGKSAQIADIRANLKAGRGFQSVAELDLYERYEEFRKRHNELNERLSKYALSPVMAYDLPSGVWRYNAVPRKARGHEIEITLRGMTLRVNGAAVIAALARLAANGELQKVRLCEQCRKNWRVSEREKDRFCSKKCSDASYQSRPEFKPRRRKIQKVWRENDKREHARELARLKGRK